METNRMLRNIFNVVINICGGLIGFWYFIYALLLITDRKDVEAESFVPFGYLMFIIGILVIVGFRIMQFFRKENKKEYLIYNLLPMIAVIITMVLWFVRMEIG